MAELIRNNESEKPNRGTQWCLPTENSNVYMKQWKKTENERIKTCRKCPGVPEDMAWQAEQPERVIGLTYGSVESGSQ